ncbi:MAG: hypothetical protein JSV89_11085 [Spirochaetaceae bacterium]|nr:MAG: hypothetical protein JSV89_11085 [Spirochaetaceae bacterium]
MSEEKQGIYKLFLMKPKDAWYRLSKEEQRKLVKKDTELSEKRMRELGGRNVLICDCFWSTEDWLLFGVEEYPDIESVQKSTAWFRKSGWFKYFESRIILGTAEMPAELKFEGDDH